MLMWVYRSRVLNTHSEVQLGPSFNPKETWLPLNSVIPSLSTLEPGNRHSLSFSVYLTARGALGRYIDIACPFVSDFGHEMYCLQDPFTYALRAVVGHLWEAEGVCCLHSSHFVGPPSTSQCSGAFQLCVASRMHAYVSA